MNYIKRKKKLRSFNEKPLGNFLRFFRLQLNISFWC